MSPAKDGEFPEAGQTRTYFAWKIFMESPVDVTVSMDDEGSGNVIIAGYLLVSTA
jgi:hypothetical protein